MLTVFKVGSICFRRNISGRSAQSIRSLAKPQPHDVKEHRIAMRGKLFASSRIGWAGPSLRDHTAACGGGHLGKVVGVWIPIRNLRGHAGCAGGVKHVFRQLVAESIHTVPRYPEHVPGEFDEGSLSAVFPQNRWPQLKPEGNGAERYHSRHNNITIIWACRHITPHPAADVGSYACMCIWLRCEQTRVRTVASRSLQGRGRPTRCKMGRQRIGFTHRDWQVVGVSIHPEHVPRWIR
jgi:hypothetical protein